MEELAARFEALLRETHDGTLGAINQTKAENSELDIMGRIEPPIFKGGKTDDLQEFFTRFERLARLQNWSPDRQAQAQPLYLKGNALTWLTIPTQNYSTLLSHLTLFRLGFFFGVPGLGGGGGIHFSKTIEDINMKLTPLINRREIILLLLSFFSCDVTKAPSWIFMAAILDSRTLPKRCQNLFFRYKFVE